jgi:hypothetical protein
MTKEKFQLSVIAAGILVLLSIIAGNLKKKPAKGQPSDNKPAQAAAPQADIAALAGAASATYAVNEEELSLQKERAELNWGRDPFTAAKISKDFRGANLQLRGISFGKDKKGLAFINNEIVKKGDIMGDYEILEVEKHKVLLRKAEQTFYLALPQE